MTLMIHLLSFLVVFSNLQRHVTSSTESNVNPGLKLRLSQTGLDYAGRIAVDLLAGKVNGFELPDQRGSWSGYVSTVNYAITKSKVTAFKKPNTFITTNARQHDLTWMALDADITISGQWSYEYTLWWTYTDSGSFTATAADVNVAIGVRLGRSPAGQPTIATTGCDSKLRGGVRLNLGGWLYNLFANVFVGFVTSRLELKICDAAKSAINVNAARALEGVRLQIDEFPSCPFDYSLVLDPVIERSYVEFSHRGDCVVNTAVNRTDLVATSPPRPPSTPLSFPPADSKMVSILLSDYSINSVVYHTYQPGSYSYKFELKDEINKFPELAAAFQNNTPSVHLVVVQPPSISFRPSLAIANIFCIARLSNSAFNDTEVTLLDVDINATLAVTLRFNGTSLTGNTSLESLAVKVRLFDGTKELPLPETVLNEAAKHLVSIYILPRFNEAGSAGFPVPHLEYLDFPGAYLELQDGAVLLATNVRYTG